MYGNFTRNACRIFCGLLLWLGAVPDVEATWYVRLHNGGASTLTFYITVDSALVVSTSVGAGSTFERNLGDAAWVEGKDLEVWTGSAGGTPVYRTDTSTSVYTLGTFASNIRVPASPHTFSSTAEPPPVEVYYRFDLVLKNNTHLTQSYRFRRTDTSAELLTVQLLSGEQGNVSIREELTPFGVAIDNGDGQPSFSHLFAEADPDVWTLEDGTPSPPTLVHGATVLDAPGPQWVLDFTPENPSDTNTLTEGTYKAGTESLYAQQKEFGNQQLVFLRSISESVGGSGLSNAATALDTSAVALGAASEGLSNAAVSFSAQVTNLNQRVAGTNDLNNDVFSSEYWLGQGKTSGEGASNEVGAALGGFSNLTNMTDFGTPTDEEWTVNLPTGNGTFLQVNLNPMIQVGLGTMAGWIHGIIAWLSAIGLLMFILKYGKQAFYAQGAFEQTKAPNIGAAGFQSSLLLAGPWIIISLGVTAALGTVVATWITASGAVSLIGSNPFSSLDPEIGRAMRLFLQFVPLDTLLLHLVVAIWFQFALLAHAALAGGIIRSLPGCILLCVLQLPGQAAEITVQNFTGTNVFVHAAGTWFQVERDWFAELGDEVTVRDYASNVLSVIDGSAPSAILVQVGWDETTSTPAMRYSVTDTVWTAFYEGMELGIIPFGLFGILWIARMMRGNAPGEGVAS